MKKKRAIWLAIVVTMIVTIFTINLLGGGKVVEHRVETDYGVRDPQFERALSSMLGPAVLTGNHVTALQNGAEIFPAMLTAIRAAEHTITFETYIYWSGEIGQQFTDALSERARAGVRVHVLMDWAGSGKMDESMLQAMRDVGAEVEKYHPIA